MDHILEMFKLATDWDHSVGRFWYPTARKQCELLAEEFTFDVRRVVYAVAALSPQLKWEKNIWAARQCLKGRIAVPGVYPANVEKAHHILYDAQDWERWLSGDKVTSFAANILGDTDVVTVDTWAWRIWAGVKLWAKPPNLANLYFDIAADYREAARVLDLEPRQVQAITWTTVRRLAYGKATWGQLSFNI